jgi:type II secretory pathway pseudopilin PulG
MTLIELLVVIVILTIVVGAAIPLLAPSSSERQLREAVRGLNTFLGAAQARAVANSRPFGIAIKRLSQDTQRADPISATNPTNDNGVATEVFIVEQPPPYAGFDANSRASIALHPDPSMAGSVLVRFVTRGLTSAGLPPGWRRDLFPPRMFRPGDVVEIGGTRFELLAVTMDPGNYTEIKVDALRYFEELNQINVPTILARPLNDCGQQIIVQYDDRGQELAKRTAAVDGRANLPFWTAAMPYRILRQPMPTSDEPYQLPEGTVIDLRASGVGDTEFFYWPSNGAMPVPPQTVDNNRHVTIMFTPEGRVERTHYYLGPNTAPVLSSEPVVENLYLLVGPNVPAPPPADADPTLKSADWSAAVTDEEKQRLREPINWLRGDSRWVVIGAATGRVATIENTFVDPESLFGIGTFATMPEEDKRSMQILAARQLTREMTQMGGR